MTTPPKPLFQQRCAVIALKYGAYALAYHAEGNSDAAAQWEKAAIAYAALANVKIESPIVQGALNAYPFGD